MSREQVDHTTLITISVVLHLRDVYIIVYCICIMTRGGIYGEI